MRILLDSHTLICWIDDPEKLIASARVAIADPTNEIYVSAVSVWELGLKASKGKLRLPPKFDATLGDNGIVSISFTVRHAAESVLLPAIHGDPFDCTGVSMPLGQSDPSHPRHDLVEIRDSRSAGMMPSVK